MNNEVIKKKTNVMSTESTVECSVSLFFSFSVIIHKCPHRQPSQLLQHNQVGK